MNTKIAMLGLVVMSAAVIGRGQPKEDFSRYALLVAATNDIYKIQRENYEPKPGEAAQIATTACQALTRLLDDKDFLADLDRMAGVAMDRQEFRNKVSKDLIEFMHSFIGPESDLLKRGGLSAEAIRNLSSAAGFLHASLVGKPDPKRIRDGIAWLRDDICGKASGLSQALTDAKEKEERKKLYAKWGVGLGGVALIGLDAAGALPSGGWTSVSFSVGEAMVGAAIGAALTN